MSSTVTRSTQQSTAELWKLFPIGRKIPSRAQEHGRKEILGKEGTQPLQIMQFLNISLHFKSAPPSHTSNNNPYLEGPKLPVAAKKGLKPF
jgi:hypothetical protein